MRPRFTETIESYDPPCCENKREVIKRPREHQDASAQLRPPCYPLHELSNTVGLPFPLKFKATEDLMLDDVKPCLFRATKFVAEFPYDVG